MDHKGNVVLIVFILIVVLLSFILIVVEIASVECNNNRDCPADSYCNADNECRQYPEEVVVREQSFLGAAWVIGMALVVAAIILRVGQFSRGKKGEE